MPTSTPTVQDLASEALSYFTASTRADGSPYTTTVEDRPEWLSELIYAAHDGMLPDDWRYRMIAESLEILSETDDPDDADTMVDGYVSVYDHELIEWYESHATRRVFADDALAQFPPEDATISRAMASGQYDERREVLAIVTDELTARLDDEPSPAAPHPGHWLAPRTTS